MADEADDRRGDSRTREIVDRVASAAATEAVAKGVPEALKRIGLDVDDPVALQQDFSFVRANRVRCDEFYREGFKEVMRFVRKIAFWAFILGVFALLGINADAIKPLLLKVI